MISDVGLEIYNITDLTNLGLICNETTILAYTGPIKIDIQNNLSLISTLHLGLIAVNMTNKTKPEIMSTLLIAEYGQSHFNNWFFFDDYLLVQDQQNGLLACNISDLSDVTIIETYDFDRAITLQRYQNTIILTSYYKYIYFLNASDPLNITISSTFDIGGKTIGLYASGDYLFMANAGGGLDILSVANPGNPTRISSVFLDAFAEEVIVSNNIAFVACYDEGVYAIDITNPAEPIILGLYVSPTTYHTYNDLAILGNLLYVANGYAGVEIVDISNPSIPILLNSFTPGYGNANGIEIQGNFAYVVDGTYELAIFDISSSIHPSPLRSLTTYIWGPREVVASGDYLFVVNLYDGFSIVDIKKPSQAEIILHYNLDDYSFHFRHLDIWGEYVYLTNSYDGLFVFDCTDVTNPVLVQRYTSTDYFYEVCVYNNFVYLANGYNGVKIFTANKTRVNGYEIPIIAIFITMSLLLSHLYKNKKRNEKQCNFLFLSIYLLVEFFIK